MASRRIVGDTGSNRGPKPRTSREEILTVALALLDSEGAAAVNIRRLAREIGLTPMALYGYFDDKEDLITAMVAAAIPSLTGVVDGEAAWQEQLEQVMREIHNAFTAHPAALDLLLSRADPDLDIIRETLIRILRSAGFDAFEAISFLTMITSFVVGSVVLGYRRGDRGAEIARIESLPQPDFPNLQSAATEYAHRGSETTFEHSLQSIIAAIEAAAPE